MPSLKEAFCFWARGPDAVGVDFQEVCSEEKSEPKVPEGEKSPLAIHEEVIDKEPQSHDEAMEHPGRAEEMDPDEILEGLARPDCRIDDNCTN